MVEVLFWCFTNSKWVVESWTRWYGLLFKAKYWVKEWQSPWIILKYQHSMSTICEIPVTWKKWAWYFSILSYEYPTSGITVLQCLAVVMQAVLYVHKHWNITTYPLWNWIQVGAMVMLLSSTVTDPWVSLKDYSIKLGNKNVYTITENWIYTITWPE